MKQTHAYAAPYPLLYLAQRSRRRAQPLVIAAATTATAQSLIPGHLFKLASVLACIASSKSKKGRQSLPGLRSHQFHCAFIAAQHYKDTQDLVRACHRPFSARSSPIKPATSRFVVSSASFSATSVFISLAFARANMVNFSISVGSTDTPPSLAI